MRTTATECADNQHIYKSRKNRKKKSLNFFKKNARKIWTIQINLVPLHRI